MSLAAVTSVVTSKIVHSEKWNDTYVSRLLRGISSVDGDRSLRRIAACFVPSFSSFLEAERKLN